VVGKAVNFTKKKKMDEIYCATFIIMTVIFFARFRFLQDIFIKAFTLFQKYDTIDIYSMEVYSKWKRYERGI